MSSLLSGATATLASYASILVILAGAQIFALLLLPALLPQGARPAGAAKALYCYLMQTLGIFLMTGAGLPALYAVLMELPFDARTFILLLITFALGGILFLRHDSAVQSVDTASRAVPRVLFQYTFRILGFGSALVALYSILLTLLFMQQPLPDRWFVFPAILLGYGLLLLRCTRWTQAPVPPKKPKSAKLPQKRKR